MNLYISCLLCMRILFLLKKENNDIEIANYKKSPWACLIILFFIDLILGFAIPNKICTAIYLIVHIFYYFYTFIFRQSNKSTISLLQTIRYFIYAILAFYYVVMTPISLENLKTLLQVYVLYCIYIFLSEPQQDLYDYVCFRNSTFCTTTAILNNIVIAYLAPLLCSLIIFKTALFNYIISFMPILILVWSGIITITLIAAILVYFYKFKKNARLITVHYIIASCVNIFMGYLLVYCYLPNLSPVALI